MEYYDVVRRSAGYISSHFEHLPKTAIVLGSGLGSLTERLEDSRNIPYSEIPGFPVSTVMGHEGKLYCGSLHGKELLCMSGRFHYYEGNDMADIAYYVRVMKVLGVENIILTNAAGGINKGFKPGDIMMITDHIKFFDVSPLRGQNYDEFGPRFSDMSFAYTLELRDAARYGAKKAGVNLKEGVYAFMPGPSYETPAEIRALGILGADAVGMSTVPEVIVAAHCGIKVLGISCITNMAAGITEGRLSHKEVFETAEKAKEGFIALIEATLEKI